MVLWNGHAGPFSPGPTPVLRLGDA